MTLAIVGTVGVPAKYGGFETLAENLVRYHAKTSAVDSLLVYCSGKSYQSKSLTYFSARLIYVPFYANGLQSVIYDIWSLFSAVRNRSKTILLLGVSGAIALPLVRLFSSARVITNIDGIEWRREKWQGWVKRFLRWSEMVAVCYSHEVIADNAAIAAYVMERYGKNCRVIAYGGDHAINVAAQPVSEFGLPDRYAFSVCRIEPENNIHMVLEAFARQPSLALVIVGNWSSSEYGRELRERFSNLAHLYLLDPIYDLGKLKSLRAAAVLYVHGHSAGGTNPSLVEAMHFGLPVLAFDCEFNRATTENRAIFFRNSTSLADRLGDLDLMLLKDNGRSMLEIGRRRYTWDVVAQSYFELVYKLD